MKSLLKAATATDPGECVNMIIQKNGSMQTIEATKNAVIVQLFPGGKDEEGRRIIKRIICIECVDDEIYPDLQKEALRIFYLDIR